VVSKTTKNDTTGDYICSVPTSKKYKEGYGQINWNKRKGDKERRPKD